MFGGKNTSVLPWAVGGPQQLKHQLEVYNQKVHGCPYQVGDHVWVLFPQVPRGMSKKLYWPWSGPFVVVKKRLDVTYGMQEVKNQHRRIVVQFNWLKVYKGDTTQYQLSRKELHSPDGPKKRKEPAQHYFGSYLEITDEEESDAPSMPTPLVSNKYGGNKPQEELPYDYPSKFAIHQVVTAKSTAECEDTYILEGELCNAYCDNCVMSLCNVLGYAYVLYNRERLCILCI